MKFLVLWQLEQGLLSDAMVRAIARMPAYGAGLEGQRKVLMRYHVVGAHGGAWLYDVDSHEEFERLLAMAERTEPALPRPAAMGGRPLRSYEELGAHRHLMISERLRAGRR